MTVLTVPSAVTVWIRVGFSSAAEEVAAVDFASVWVVDFCVCSPGQHYALPCICYVTNNRRRWYSFRGTSRTVVDLFEDVVAEDFVGVTVTVFWTVSVTWRITVVGSA